MAKLVVLVVLVLAGLWKVECIRRFGFSKNGPGEPGRAAAARFRLSPALCFHALPSRKPEAVTRCRQRSLRRPWGTLGHLHCISCCRVSLQAAEPVEEEVKAQGSGTFPQGAVTGSMQRRIAWPGRASSRDLTGRLRHVLGRLLSSPFKALTADNM